MQVELGCTSPNIKEAVRDCWGFEVFLLPHSSFFRFRCIPLTWLKLALLTIHSTVLSIFQPLHRARKMSERAAILRSIVITSSSTLNALPKNTHMTWLKRNFAYIFFLLSVKEPINLKVCLKALGKFPRALPLPCPPPKYCELFWKTPWDWMCWQLKGMFLRLLQSLTMIMCKWMFLLSSNVETCICLQGEA